MNRNICSDSLIHSHTHTYWLFFPVSAEQQVRLEPNKKRQGATDRVSGRDIRTE